MTAAQKKARENFSKAIAYRKKTGCTLKQAFAHVKGGKIKGLDKVVKKGNKTAVIYSKKEAPKKKAAPKKKVLKQSSLFGVDNNKTNFDIMNDTLINSKAFNGWLVKYPYGDQHDFVATSYKALKKGLKEIKWVYKPVIYAIETWKAKPNFRKLSSVQLKTIYSEL